MLKLQYNTTIISDIAIFQYINGFYGYYCCQANNIFYIADGRQQYSLHSSANWATAINQLAYGRGQYIKTKKISKEDYQVIFLTSLTAPFGIPYLLDTIMNNGTINNRNQQRDTYAKHKHPPWE